MRTPHTSFKKGKKLLVIKKDGSRVVGRYEGKKSGVMMLEGMPRIPISEIRVATFFKDRAHESL